MKQKLLFILTLLLCVCSGAWATDIDVVEHATHTYKTFPVNGGLFTVTNTANMAISSNQLQVKNATGKFQISTTISGYVIKSIVFTDKNSSKNDGFTCADGDYMTGPTDTKYTYTAPAGTTAANFQLIGKSGTAGMEITSLVLTTSDNIHELYGFTTSPSWSFSSNPASDITVTTTNSSGFSLSGSTINWFNNSGTSTTTTKDITITASDNIKYVAFVIKEDKKPANNKMIVSGATGAYSDGVWTASAATKSVAFRQNTGGGINVEKIYVATETSTPAGEYKITKGTHVNGDFSISPTSADEGDEVTLTATPNTGYQFGSWSVTGDTSGDVVTVTNNKFTMPAEDVTVNATFTAKSYTVTLNNQSATTAGTASVTTTYNANTNLTSSIISPEKTDYVFMGYFTATNGGGKQLIDKSGAWIANVDGYTDASKNWKYDGDVTLYAFWMQKATDADFEAWVQTNLTSGATANTAANYSAAIGAHNIVYSLGGNTALDYSVNANYQGLKIKNNGDYLMFLVEGGKGVKFTFGYVDTKPKLSIDGASESDINITTLRAAAGNDQVVSYDAAVADRLFKVRSVTANAVVLKKIEFVTPVVDSRKETTTEITDVSISALNKDLANGTAGGTLAATVTPEGESALDSPTITWFSSNTEVATIGESTGIVTLVAVGSTTITATYDGDAENYKGSSDTYELTVTNTPSLTAVSDKLWKVGDTNWNTDNIEYNGGFADPSGDSKDIDGVNFPKSTKMTDATTDNYVHFKIANNTTVVVFGRSNSGSGTIANLYVGDTSAEPAATSSWGNDKAYKVAYTNTSGSEQDIYFCGLTNQYRVLGVWVMPNTISVTITAAGYASYAPSYPLNFAETGIAAYIATENGTESVTMTEITNVPANTGVILKGSSASVPVLGATAADATTGNLLKPGPKTVSAAEAEAETIYAFGKKGDKIGFVKAAEDYTIAAGKAYLDLSGAAAKGADFLTFVFDDNTDGPSGETTFIKALNGEVMDSNVPMYNLAGQKVSESYKGIVIVNGRKVIRK